MTRTRRLIGALTLLVLLLILVGITGFEVPVPRFGASAPKAQLAGIRPVGSSMLLRVGAGAPPGGELAFLALEPSGNLIISDAKRRTVMRFDATGQLLSEWGPRFEDLELSEPAGVATFGNSVFVVDRGTPRIFELDTGGRPQRIIDLQPLGTYGLNGLAIDANANLFVADTGRNRILVLGPDGQLLKQVGHGGSDLGGFTQPMMLGFQPNGDFLVADWENERVERWSANFEAVAAWSVGFRPFGLAVDETGRVYVPDADHRRVEVYSPDGDSLGAIGAPSAAPIDVSPRQVAVTPSDPPALYLLGSDAMERVDLENALPPPSSSVSVGLDIVNVSVVALVIALLGLAVLSRRQRRAAASLGPALHRPVRLNSKDGAQRQ